MKEPHNSNNKKIINNPKNKNITQERNIFEIKSQEVKNFIYQNSKLKDNKFCAQKSSISNISTSNSHRQTLENNISNINSNSKPVNFMTNNNTNIKNKNINNIGNGLFKGQKFIDFQEPFNESIKPIKTQNKNYANKKNNKLNNLNMNLTNNLHIKNFEHDDEGKFKFIKDENEKYYDNITQLNQTEEEELQGIERYSGCSLDNEDVNENNTSYNNLQVSKDEADVGSGAENELEMKNYFEVNQQNIGYNSSKAITSRETDRYNKKYSDLEISHNNKYFKKRENSINFAIYNKDRLNNDYRSNKNDDDDLISKSKYFYNLKKPFHNFKQYFDINYDNVKNNVIRSNTPEIKRMNKSKSKDLDNAGFEPNQDNIYCSQAKIISKRKIISNNVDKNVNKTISGINKKLFEQSNIFLHNEKLRDISNPHNNLSERNFDIQDFQQQNNFSNLHPNENIIYDFSIQSNDRSHINNEKINNSINNNMIFKNPQKPDLLSNKNNYNIINQIKNHDIVSDNHFDFIGSKDYTNTNNYNLNININNKAKDENIIYENLHTFKCEENNNFVNYITNNNASPNIENNLNINQFNYGNQVKYENSKINNNKNPSTTNKEVNFLDLNHFQEILKSAELAINPHYKSNYNNNNSQIPRFRNKENKPESNQNITNFSSIPVDDIHQNYNSNNMLEYAHNNNIVYNNKDNPDFLKILIQLKNGTSSLDKPNTKINAFPKIDEDSQSYIRELIDICSDNNTVNNHINAKITNQHFAYINDTSNKQNLLNNAENNSNTDSNQSTNINKQNIYINNDLMGSNNNTNRDLNNQDYYDNVHSKINPKFVSNSLSPLRSENIPHLNNPFVENNGDYTQKSQLLNNINTKNNLNTHNYAASAFNGTGSQQSSSTIKTNVNNQSRKPLNTNDLIEITKRRKNLVNDITSVDGYFRRRHLETLAKMERLKKEKNNPSGKTSGNYIPQINKRSREIAKRISGGSFHNILFNENNQIQITKNKNINVTNEINDINNFKEINQINPNDIINLSNIKECVNNNNFGNINHPSEVSKIQKNINYKSKISDINNNNSILKEIEDLIELDKKKFDDMKSSSDKILLENEAIPKASNKNLPQNKFIKLYDLNEILDSERCKEDNSNNINTYTKLNSHISGRRNKSAGNVIKAQNYFINDNLNDFNMHYYDSNVHIKEVVPNHNNIQSSNIQLNDLIIQNQQQNQQSALIKPDIFDILNNINMNNNKNPIIPSIETLNKQITNQQLNILNYEDNINSTNNQKESNNKMNNKKNQNVKGLNLEVPEYKNYIHTSTDLVNYGTKTNQAKPVSDLKNLFNNLNSVNKNDQQQYLNTIFSESLNKKFMFSYDNNLNIQDDVYQIKSLASLDAQVNNEYVNINNSNNKNNYNQEIETKSVILKESIGNYKENAQLTNSNKRVNTQQSQGKSSVDHVEIDIFNSDISLSRITAREKEMNFLANATHQSNFNLNNNPKEDIDVAMSASKTSIQLFPVGEKTEADLNFNMEIFTADNYKANNVKSNSNKKHSINNKNFVQKTYKNSNQVNNNTTFNNNNTIAANQTETIFNTNTSRDYETINHVNTEGTVNTNNNTQYNPQKTNTSIDNSEILQAFSEKNNKQNKSTAINMNSSEFKNLKYKGRINKIYTDNNETEDNENKNIKNNPTGTNNNYKNIIMIDETTSLLIPNRNELSPSMLKMENNPRNVTSLSNINHNNQSINLSKFTNFVGNSNLSNHNITNNLTNINNANNTNNISNIKINKKTNIPKLFTGINYYQNLINNTTSKTNISSKNMVQSYLSSERNSNVLKEKKMAARNDIEKDKNNKTSDADNTNLNNNKFGDDASNINMIQPLVNLSISEQKEIEELNFRNGNVNSKSNKLILLDNTDISNTKALMSERSNINSNEKNELNKYNYFDGEKLLISTKADTKNDKVFNFDSNKINLYLNHNSNNNAIKNDRNLNSNNNYNVENDHFQNNMNYQSYNTNIANNIFPKENILNTEEKERILFDLGSDDENTYQEESNMNKINDNSKKLTLGNNKKTDIYRNERFENVNPLFVINFNPEEKLINPKYNNFKPNIFESIKKNPFLPANSNSNSNNNNNKNSSNSTKGKIAKKSNLEINIKPNSSTTLLTKNNSVKSLNSKVEKTENKKNIESRSVNSQERYANIASENFNSNNDIYLNKKNNYLNANSLEIYKKKLKTYNNIPSNRNNHNNKDNNFSNLENQILKSEELMDTNLEIKVENINTDYEGNNFLNKNFQSNNSDRDNQNRNNNQINDVNNIKANEKVCYKAVINLEDSEMTSIFSNSNSNIFKISNLNNKNFENPNNFIYNKLKEDKPFSNQTNEETLDLNNDENDNDKMIKFQINKNNKNFNINNRASSEDKHNMIFKNIKKNKNTNNNHAHKKENNFIKKKTLLALLNCQNQEKRFNSVNKASNVKNRNQSLNKPGNSNYNNNKKNGNVATKKIINSESNNLLTKKKTGKSLNFLNNINNNTRNNKQKNKDEKIKDKKINVLSQEENKVSQKFHTINFGDKNPYFYSNPNDNSMNENDYSFLNEFENKNKNVNERSINIDEKSDNQSCLFSYSKKSVENLDFDHINSSQLKKQNLINNFDNLEIDNKNYKNINEIIHDDYVFDENFLINNNLNTESSKNSNLVFSIKTANNNNNAFAKYSNEVKNSDNSNKDYIKNVGIKPQSFE